MTHPAGTYNSKDVVTGVTVDSLAPATSRSRHLEPLLSNYVLPTTATGTGAITHGDVDRFDRGHSDQAYDGTTAATLASANYNLAGVVSGESHRGDSPRRDLQLQGRGQPRDAVTSTTLGCGRLRDLRDRSPADQLRAADDRDRPGSYHAGDVDGDDRGQPESHRCPDQGIRWH